MTNPQYILAADGACSGNPGPGGWAFLLISAMPGGTPTVLDLGHGLKPDATNNQMELAAAEAGLDAIISAFERQEIPAGAQIALRFDSNYALDGILEWLPGWKANNWRTAAKKPVKNLDQWKSIDRLLTYLRAAGLDVRKDWVKGHNGDWANEQVDSTATDARDCAKPNAAPRDLNTEWLERLETDAANPVHIEPALGARIAREVFGFPETPELAARVAHEVLGLTEPHAPMPPAVPAASAPITADDLADPSIAQISALSDACTAAGMPTPSLPQVLALYRELRTRTGALGLA